MNLDSLNETAIIALPQVEQAMAWLVSNGPIVNDPPIPNWILRRLVDGRRIMRLRRSLYLVPSAEARLIGVGPTVNALDPEGYVSGLAALALHGLTDQDIAEWWSISPRRQSDIRYGRIAVHFIYSPDRARSGARVVVTQAGEEVTVATPDQAIVDELRFLPDRIDWLATARMLAEALAQRATTPRELTTLLSRDRAPSAAVARRLGFLLEAVGASAPEPLFAMSRRTHDVTAVPGAKAHVDRWRLVSPVSEQEIQRGIQG
jgi:predicted transcriptional regulator of viral defense system